MTNLEYLVTRELIDSSALCGVAYRCKHKRSCIGIKCEDCEFYKDIVLCLKALLEEHKEITKMTLHEKCILESLPNEYSYIARDENGDLYIYGRKPIKENDFWFLPDPNAICSLNLYSNLFEFIKWEDGVLHIKDILKDCEVVEND